MYTLPNGDFDRDSFEDKCRPIIYEVLGWEEGEKEDEDTPSLCFTLCLDIAKKRKRYLTKLKKPKVTKTTRRRLQTVPGTTDDKNHLKKGALLWTMRTTRPMWMLRFRTAMRLRVNKYPPLPPPLV